MIRLIFIGLLWPMLSMAAPQGFSTAQIHGFQTKTQTALQQSGVQAWVHRVEEGSKSNRLSLPHKPRRAHLMVLTSFSMPKATLLHYMYDAIKVNASLVLRGFVHNSMPDTAKAIHELIHHNQGGFSIDPVIFEKLNVKKVPAVVLLSPEGLACINAPSCLPNADEYDILYGNVTLHFALSQFAKGQDTLAQRASKDLKRLDGSTHEQG